MWQNEVKEHYRHCSASLPRENLVFEALLKYTTFLDVATSLPAYATFVQSAQIFFIQFEVWFVNNACQPDGMLNVFLTSVIYTQSNCVYDRLSLQ